MPSVRWRTISTAARLDDVHELAPAALLEDDLTGRDVHEARSADIGAVLRHQVDDPVGDGYEPVVVGGDHDGAAVGSQVAQERDDPLGLDVVEVGGGFVGQQHRRVGRQPAGDRDALLLAAGELAGPLCARALGQADPLRGARRPGRIAVLRRTPARSSGMATFSRAVSDGMRLKAWNTKPTVRWR